MMKNILDIIKSKSILSCLTDQEMELLLSVAETIQLNNKEVLFYKGDTSRDMYIVLSGKLITTFVSTSNIITKDEIVAYIMPGELVGEMSLLTSAPRSLTVLADETSSLLKISHENFNQCFQHNSEAAFKILKIVIERAQHVIKKLDKTLEAKCIAFVPTNEHVSLYQLISQIQNIFSNQTHSCILDKTYLDNTPDKTLLEQFNHLKRTHQLVVYPIDLSFSAQKIDFLIHQANKIIFVAPGDKPVELNDIASRILKNNATTFITPKAMSEKIRLELVLLYENQDQIHYDTQTWLQMADFSRHHHISLHKIEDMKRLARYMKGSAVGLVLGGGGLMRGWAHVGVLKYLLDMNIPVDAIGGTSIGGILGASFLLNMNLNDCIEIYKKFCILLAKGFDLRSVILPIISIFNGKTATIAAQKGFPGLIENLPLPFFCISCNISQNIEAIHDHGLLWEAIRATGSLPGLIPPLVIDNQLHVDGAVINNLPVDVMSDYLEQSGTIIAVSLSEYSPHHMNYSFPPYISFWTSLLIKLGIKKNYQFPNFLNTFFDSLLIGSNLQQQVNMQKADILILPEVRQYSALSRRGSSEEMITLGYQAAKLAFERNERKFDF